MQSNIQVSKSKSRSICPICSISSTFRFAVAEGDRAVLEGSQRGFFPRASAVTALPPIPPELRALMAEIGPRWGESVTANVRLMVEEFSRVLRTCPRDGVEVRRDIAYGPHERQAFDLYLPEGGGTGRPGLVFVHGGAFVEGHRNRSEEIYANVLRYFARHGVVGINMGYRLAPEAKFPDSAQDVGAVVRWAREAAPDLGLDRDRLFLMGHSAGAAHAGSYAYDRSIHPPEGPGLAGLIVLSGRVRADNQKDN